MSSSKKPLKVVKSNGDSDGQTNGTPQRVASSHPLHECVCVCVCACVCVCVCVHVCRRYIHMLSTYTQQLKGSVTGAHGEVMLAELSYKQHRNQGVCSWMPLEPHSHPRIQTCSTCQCQIWSLLSTWSSRQHTRVLHC